MFIGLGLAYASIWLPIQYFVRQIMWVKTEALYVDQVISEDGDSGYLTLEFKDTNGIRRTATVDIDDSVMEGSDDKHYLVYYNPRDPTQSIPANHGFYLILLFAPFAVLLCYVGLPERFR
jgi:hypothetical protein